MVRTYYKAVYMIQLTATTLLFIGLFLGWHAQFGTGWQVMRHALKAEEGIVWIDQQHEPIFSISAWWLVLLIPLTGLFLGVRALNGIFFVELRSKGFFALMLCGWLVLGFAWCLSEARDQLHLGFWAGVMSTLTLLGGVFVEFLLPDYP